MGAFTFSEQGEEASCPNAVMQSVRSAVVGYGVAPVLCLVILAAGDTYLPCPW